MTVEGADFTLNSVMIAAAGASSTCGLSDAKMEVLFLTPDVNGSGGGISQGGIHMNFDVTDPSGACEAVCDMTEYTIRAISVPGPHTDPYEKEYSMCVKLHNTCQ